MAEECTHNCSTCGADCASRKQESLLAEPNADSKIRRVIGIVSGKGGVGKSLVTSMMSVLMSRKGYHVGIIDADITGPSIPTAFGLAPGVETTDNALFPKTTATGIDVMSLNLLVEDPESPVVWRGPVIAGTVKQFWTDVIWTDIDYMFVDCPPGTGDVPLTVFQSLPLDGIIIVTSPQELVSMIVKKAIKMAGMMNIPVLGLVENMSYVKCPDCGKELHIFGESHIDEIAAQYGTEVLGRIPMDPAIAALVDAGSIEAMEADYLAPAADRVESLLKD